MKNILTYWQIKEKNQKINLLIKNSPTHSKTEKKTNKCSNKKNKIETVISAQVLLFSAFLKRLLVSLISGWPLFRFIALENLTLGLIISEIKFTGRDITIGLSKLFLWKELISFSKYLMAKISFKIFFSLG